MQRPKIEIKVVPSCCCCFGRRDRREGKYIFTIAGASLRLKQPVDLVVA